MYRLKKLLILITSLTPFFADASVFEYAWKCSTEELSMWVKVADCNFNRNVGYPGYIVSSGSFSLYRMCNVNKKNEISFSYKTDNSRYSVTENHVPNGLYALDHDTHFFSDLNKDDHKISLQTKFSGAYHPRKTFTFKRDESEIYVLFEQTDGFMLNRNQISAYFSCK